MERHGTKVLVVGAQETRIEFTKSDEIDEIDEGRQCGECNGQAAHTSAVVARNCVLFRQSIERAGVLRASGYTRSKLLSMACTAVVTGQDRPPGQPATIDLAQTAAAHRRVHSVPLSQPERQADPE